MDINLTILYKTVQSLLVYIRRNYIYSISSRFVYNDFCNGRRIPLFYLYFPVSFSLYLSISILIFFFISISTKESRLLTIRFREVYLPSARSYSHIACVSVGPWSSISPSVSFVFFSFFFFLFCYTFFSSRLCRPFPLLSPRQHRSLLTVGNFMPNAITTI